MFQKSYLKINLRLIVRRLSAKLFPVGEKNESRHKQASRDEKSTVRLVGSHVKISAVRLVGSHVKISVKTIPGKFLFSFLMFTCKEEHIKFLHF